jgi:signal transduction histidine kinase
MRRVSGEAGWRPWVVWSTAASVTLLGALALAGWALDLDLLTRLVPERATMKPNTALALVLAGGALAGLGWATPRSWWAGAGGAAVFVIALAALVEQWAGVDLGIDEWLFRDRKTPGELYPGRIPLASALALLLTGTTLLLSAWTAKRAIAARVARAFSVVILAIGAVGLLGHLFQVVVLYTWHPFGFVSVPTVMAFALLGIGLLAAPCATMDPPRVVTEDQRIIRAAALAMILAAGVMGIAGVAALESQIRRSAESDLEDLLATNFGELRTNLELRATKAAIVASRPNMRRYLRVLGTDPANREAREVVQGVLASFLSHDFSRLVAFLPSGEEVARAGPDAAAPTTLDVPLGSSGTAHLFWREGLGLRHELALSDSQGPLGTIVVEQLMPRPTEILTGNQLRFASAEFLLCVPREPIFQCFPSRLSPAPIVVPPGQPGVPRLIQRALTEGVGVGTGVDYRGHQVIGAYAPLPGLGLAGVLKVDADELYGASRRQLALALLVVVAVTFGGVALVRARVGPLAARLEGHVRQRTADLQQLNARLSILHEVDKGLLSSRTSEGIAETALLQLRDLLGVPRVIVNLFDLATGEAEWLVGVGRHRARVGRGVRFPMALMGDVEALRRGEPQVIDVDALPKSSAAEALLDSGVHAYMVVPMIAGGELIGGLSFGGSSREFSADQVAIVEEVARQMAIAIDHARLLERVTQYATELEERVRTRTAELEAAQAELVRRERLAILGQLAGGVSHELRNPLGVIKNSVYYLRMILPDEERLRRHLAILDREVGTATRIITGMLDFARSTPPARTSTDLSALAREAVERLIVPESSRVESDLVEGLEPVIIDSHQIGLVLDNLLLNAIQAMPDGGVVTVRTRPAGSRVEISVEDTGVGIAPEHLERIFEPLFTTKSKGIGLGLSLVKRLVEANNGAIRVESAPGSTRFLVELS